AGPGDGTASQSHGPDPVTYSTTVSDPDDTAGRLDIAAVGHTIVVRRGRPTSVRYRIRTYSRFSDSDLDRRFRNLVIELDRDGEPGSELNVLVYSRHRQLRADLISNATREVIGHVDVDRLGPRLLRLRGPADTIGARKYFWTSNYHHTGVHECGWYSGWPLTCQDTAPQRGWIRLDRPGWPSLDV
ncbi:MAG: hypothetical protein ACRDP1_14370, partial [Nocardioidaceae bacterium]